MIDLGNGVPAITSESPSTFEEFWPFFVSQHLHPKTRAVHALGAFVHLGVGAALLLGTRRWNTIAGASMLAVTAQVMSHRVFEGNRATDTDRVASPRYHWIFIADFLMVAKTVSGTMREDVSQVREALGLKPDQATLGAAPSP
jgi:hypothetical protein